MDEISESPLKASITKSGNKYREIFYQSPVGIIFYNKEGYAIKANKSAIEITGIKNYEGILGHNLFDNPTIGDKKEELMEKSTIKFRAPLNFVLINGNGYHYPDKNRSCTLDNIISVTDFGFLVQIQDISQCNIRLQKLMDEDLKLAQDHLEEIIEERTLELEKDYNALKSNELKLKEMIEELKRSNKELKSFAYITSHDLQEPLRTISSYAELLKRRYEGQLDEDADDFIEYMVDGTSRMQQMIKVLLDYSRIGTQGKKFEKFNVEEAFNNALSNLQLRIEESNAEITHDTLPEVMGDLNQICRVFQNLINNGLKFHKKNIPPQIHVSAKKNGTMWIFSIKDNGIGIENQYKNKVFEVFKRLHTMDEYPGSGISLAIVKRIIDRHGGRVWVKSDLGVGSTFYFTIPIKSPLNRE